jgi:hypothetical protein
MLKFCLCLPLLKNYIGSKTKATLKFQRRLGSSKPSGTANQKPPARQRIAFPKVITYS